MADNNSDAGRPAGAPSHRLATLFAWCGAHPGIAALGCGALAAAGFEPLHWWPLTLIGVAGLLALTTRCVTCRGAGLIGWLWGWAHFCLALNWIATAFTFQAKMPAWLGWIGVVGLSAYLAVFPALAAAGAWWFRRNRIGATLAFAGLWIISEWLRGWVFTGFPWDPLAVVLLGGPRNPGFASISQWMGTYGLSGLVILLAGAIYDACAQIESAPPQRRLGVVARSLLPVAVLLILMLVGDGPPEGEGTIPFTLVQPNYDQRTIDDPAHFPAQFDQMARAMGGTPAAGRLVLWSESGVPDYLRDGYPAWAYSDTFAQNPAAARARLAALIGPQSLLLTGAQDPVLSPGGDRFIGARNVITAIDGHGAITGSYAKAHLVPYGEYLPLRPWLTPLGIARLVPGDLDIIPGPGPQTLDLGRFGKVGVQICYEIVFSGEVVDRAHRPDYVIAPSNDGWFGAWGPPQHLAQARLRAIEEGLPVLRATTSGISAVIDADGIIRDSTPRGQAGHIDGLIPPAHPLTMFARLGNVLPLGWAIGLLGVAVLVLRRHRA